MHTPYLVTTTHLGLPLPSIRLAHPSTIPWPCAITTHATPPLPWVTPRLIFVCMCMHAPDLGQQTPISTDPYRFSWGFQCTTTPSLTPSGPLQWTFMVSPVKQACSCICLTLALGTPPTCSVCQFLWPCYSHCMPTPYTIFH